MAQFLGDIAFGLWTLLFAGGLIAWHIGVKESAGLIKTAAAVLVVVGVAGAACTSYFWFKYYNAGQFDSAYSTVVPMQNMQGSPMRGMMRMMDGQMPMQDGFDEPLTPEQREYLEDPGKHPM